MNVYSRSVVIFKYVLQRCVQWSLVNKSIREKFLDTSIIYRLNIHGTFGMWMSASAREQDILLILLKFFFHLLMIFLLSNQLS